MTHIARPEPAGLSPFEAVVFDLDGTLVDTEPTYRAAFAQAAAALGLAVPTGLYDSVVGVASPERRAVLGAAFGPAFEPDAFFAEYYARRSALLPGRIPARRGADDLLRSLRLPAAVATSASRRTAESHLLRSGLARHFAHVVTRDDVARGKPAPDVFLLAAERLGVRPGMCVAVEDSPAGAASALAAGMQVVVVAAPASPKPRQPCLVVADFGGLAGLVAGARGRAAPACLDFGGRNPSDVCSLAGP